MMRIESSWSELPHAPSIIVPRQSFETWTPVRPRGRYSIPFTLVRVLVLAPGAGLLRGRLGRSVEQEGVIRRHEGVGGRHRVGVVDRSVVAREGDEARVLAQAVLEL